jgi:hypothetical protein
VTVEQIAAKLYAIFYASRYGFDEESWDKHSARLNAELRTSFERQAEWVKARIDEAVAERGLEDMGFTKV